MASALGTKRASDRSMEKCEGCRSKRVKVSPNQASLLKHELCVFWRIYLTVPSVCQQPETGPKARDAIRVKTKMKIAGRTHGRENLPGKRRQTSGRPTACWHLPHHQPPFLRLCLLFLTIHLRMKCPFQTIASSQWASLARSSRNRPRLQLQKLQSRRLRLARL